MTRLALFLLCVFPVFAQRGTYTHERTTAGSSEKVTLHLPSSEVNRTARLVGVSVYCANACTAELQRDGTAPTATAATAKKLNANAETPSVVPYNASNVGSGTTIKNYNVSAGQELVIDLSNKGLRPGENVTVIPSLSGARVFYEWSEN